MSWPLDVIECSTVIDSDNEGRNVIIHKILNDKKLGEHNWEVISDMYPEPEVKEFHDEEELVEDLLLLSHLGTMGKVIAADQLHGAIKYVLDGKDKVKSYESTGYKFRKTLSQEYTYRRNGK